MSSGLHQRHLTFLSRDKARHGIWIHVGVYSKDDTMAHTRRLVVTS